MHFLAVTVFSLKLGLNWGTYWQFGKHEELKTDKRPSISFEAFSHPKQ